MSLVHLGLGYQGPNWPLQLAGTVLLTAPLLRRTEWSDPAFRLRLLSSLLLYSVLFNHKAEQPTFIVALTGMAIWYATSPRSLVRDALLVSSIALMVPVFITAILGQWSPSAAALTLPALRLAAVPCLLAWLAMQGELIGLVPLRASLNTRYARASGEIAVATEGAD